MKDWTCKVIVVAFHLWASSIVQAQAANIVEMPTEWVGVEVIANDDAAIPVVRKLAGIMAGESIAYSSPRLKLACQRIRKHFPSMTVTCQGILMAENRSLYVIELRDTNDSTAEKTATCGASAALDKPLEALHDSLNNGFDAALTSLSAKDDGEFINANGNLDFYANELHNIAEQYSDRLKGKFSVLEAAAKSCNEDQRAKAVWLMNFSGQPDSAARVALHMVLDPSEAVRNNAMRLLASFSTYVNAEERAELLRRACDNFSKTNFLDRNKSLALILALLRDGTARSSEIPSSCKRKIDSTARVSISDQIGGMARHIQELMSQ